MFMPRTWNNGMLECWNVGATWQWLPVEREGAGGAQALLSKI